MVKKIKLYHLDRSGYLKEKVTIDYINDIELKGPFLKINVNQL